MSTSPNTYMNRELSWLDFNSRVLEEAYKPQNPILERLRFLAITASNLDEFYMVRVAGVKHQVSAGYQREDASGYMPEQLMEELTVRIRAFTAQQYACLYEKLIPALADHNIVFRHANELRAQQLQFISTYFDSVVFPILTPIAVDEERQFPKVLSMSLNIAVRLRRKGRGETHFAVVPVPSNIPRFIELPSASGSREFILLEEIIMYRMSALFAAYQIKACCPFRILRNAAVEIDDEAPDLLAEVQKSIKKRKQGKPIYLEIPKEHDADIKEFLTSSLKLKKAEVYKLEGPLNLTFFSKFANLPGADELRFDPIVPVSPPAEFCEYDDIFEAIRAGDRLVHHPYESFDAVIELVQRAADDPDVLAIKQTLYRVSGHSPIIDGLIRAAQNGKQVTVMVELKARFDEENNVGWAQKLEKAGCHVIYGIPGLKTHCKVLLVVRKEENRIRNYVHMATGNYNDSTAKLYTDIGLFTCNEAFGSDAMALFNMLTGYAERPSYQKIIVAPDYLRMFFEDMIRREIAHAQRKEPCGITAKINSLVDPQMIGLLYKASQAGVPVRLIVRGICCLFPGRQGLSDKIAVHSVVGQLLEHSRIFRFENGGDWQLYIGSADWMQRNLDRRVEVVFPVEDAHAKARVNEILDIMWKDTYNTRVMQPDGSYQHVAADVDQPVNCQRLLFEMARSAQKKAIRQREMLRRRSEGQQAVSDKTEPVQAANEHAETVPPKKQSLWQKIKNFIGGKGWRA